MTLTEVCLVALTFCVLAATMSYCGAAKAREAWDRYCLERNREKDRLEAERAERGFE